MTEATVSTSRGDMFWFFFFLECWPEKGRLIAAQAAWANICVRLLLRSNNSQGVKAENVSNPMINLPNRGNAPLSSKVTQLRLTRHQRWPHHILKCGVNSG